ncbi:MAG: ATP-binding protein [Pseudomonadota bacterium]
MATKPEVRRVFQLTQQVAKLFNEESFASLVFENIPDAFFIKDEQFRILYGNPALFDLYPTSLHDRIIGFTTAEEFDDPEQAAAFLENDRLALETGESAVVETLDFPDGKRRTLFTRKIRFENQDGKPHILGLARDITEIVKGQDALRRSEQRYALAVEGAAVGIWDLDVPQGTVVWSTRALEVIEHDYGPQGPSFDQFVELIHEEDRAFTLEEFDAHINNGTPFNVEYRLRRPDGTYEWIHARGQARWNDAGEATRVAGSIEDITSRKRAQLRLLQQNEQLNEFAHIASHDLKAPLRGMCSHIDMIKEDHGSALDPDVMERLDRMQSLTNRMEELIVDLLKLARVAEGERYAVPIDLNSVVDSAIALIPDWDHASVEVAQLPEVACEPVSVRELYRNLILNALKYNTRERPEVSVGVLEQEPDSPRRPPVFFVRDNGIGIAAVYHDSIFKIFRRLHGKDEYGGGTGAGLTFVKRIVERHGGHIWVESTPGQGSTFFFTLSP